MLIFFSLPCYTAFVLFSVMQALKKGIAQPFLYWQVVKFLPRWAKVAESGSVGKPGKRLDMVMWSAAYQGFALASASVGMWDWHLSNAHHTNCMKVASKYSVSHLMCCM